MDPLAIFGHVGETSLVVPDADQTGYSAICITVYTDHPSAEFGDGDDHQ
jgi:hypothetical protein